MANNNVDLFSYFPGIEVTTDDILQAELVAYQVLKAKYPDMDLREGTALRDLAIRPTATLLAMVNKALVFYFAQNTISGTTNDTPQVFVDKLLSNWFLTRKQGQRAVINARLYFAKSKPIAITPDIFFSTDGTLKFFPITSASYGTTDLTFDSASNQYYIDIELQAESAGKSYNISSGSLIYFTNFDAFFLHAEINFLKTLADDVETNSAFITRAQTAISTRNLINVPSINSNLLEAFPILEGVDSYGFGDPEMIRDQIKVLVPGVADPIWIHNGGSTDIYCRVPLASSILQLQTDAFGKIYLTGSVYKFSRSSVSGGASADTLPLLLTQPVTSITRSGTTATVTTTSPHGYTTGQLITIQGAVQTGYNLASNITVTGASTFTYTVDGTLTTPATGTITAGKDYPYTTNNFYEQAYALGVGAVTRSGSVATITYANHGLMLGERIKISGAAQAEYNGVFVVASVPTRDTVTITVSGTPVTPATGTIILTYIDRLNEVGFSDRQTLTIDFGGGQPNKTASFLVFYHQGLDGVQEYLSDPVRRVLCADSLARGYNLTVLTANITSYNGPAASSETCSTVIKVYLSSLLAGQPFIMADLLAKLYAAGVTTIKTPIDITYIKYWKDQLNTTSGTITDNLNPNDTTNIFVLDTVTTTSQVI